MKTIPAILFSCFLSLISFAQTELLLGIDCNPKLNADEILYFKTRFATDSFDFLNKNIGFSTNHGFKTWGFENSFLPITKREFFTLNDHGEKSTLKYKLIVLDSMQRRETKGFDAIVLAYHMKYENKANKSKFNRIIKIFGYRALNYPDNLNEVENEKIPGLTTQDASFLNQIFKWSRGEFDFTGKKIAIISTQANSIIPKSEFIEKIKKHLHSDFLYPYDFLYIFNSKEKVETGGYDAAIIYDCKKCNGKDAIVILKKNGT